MFLFQGPGRLGTSKSKPDDRFNPQAHKLFDPRELRTSLIECVDIPVLRVITARRCHKLAQIAR